MRAPPSPPSIANLSVYEKALEGAHVGAATIAESDGGAAVRGGGVRAVRPGRVLCPAHARGAYGRELEAAVGRMARQMEQAFTAAQETRPVATPASTDVVVEPHAAALATFERRVARGDYGELFDERLRAVMAQAAAERGIAEEIGALRVVLARLMTDPAIDPLHRP